MSKKTEKQFQKALEATRALEEDVSYYVNREWDQRFYGSDYDDHYECGCCKCCGHSDACYDRMFEAARKQWPLRIKVRSLLGKLFRR